MPDFLDLDLYYGLAGGGAFIWLFRGWVEKRKAQVEAKAKELLKR